MFFFHFQSICFELYIRDFHIMAYQIVVFMKKLDAQYPVVYSSEKGHLKLKLKQWPVRNFYLYVEAISCGTSKPVSNKHTKQNNFLPYLFAYLTRICSSIKTTQKQVFGLVKDANKTFTAVLRHRIYALIFSCGPFCQRVNIFRFSICPRVASRSIFDRDISLSKINGTISREDTRHLKITFIRCMIFDQHKMQTYKCIFHIHYSV